MRRHDDRFVGAIGVAAAAAVAVLRIYHGDRLAPGVRQEGQREQQDGGAEDQRPHGTGRGQVGQRMEEEDEPVEAGIVDREGKVGRRIRYGRLDRRQQQEGAQRRQHDAPRRQVEPVS